MKQRESRDREETERQTHANADDGRRDPLLSWESIREADGVTLRFKEIKSPHLVVLPTSDSAPFLTVCRSKLHQLQPSFVKSRVKVAGRERERVSAAGVSAFCVEHLTKGRKEGARVARSLLASLCRETCYFSICLPPSLLLSSPLFPWERLLFFHFLSLFPVMILLPKKEEGREARETLSNLRHGSWVPCLLACCCRCCSLVSGRRTSSSDSRITDCPLNGPNDGLQRRMSRLVGGLIAFPRLHLTFCLFSSSLRVHLPVCACCSPDADCLPLDSDDRMTGVAQAAILGSFSCFLSIPTRMLADSMWI